ncbi:MAG: hypothetical protein J7M25_09375 [Deltaproteobacteria bacterium]|nr:hypothetical protein [Deltaproteobacteria bacterium]
MSQLDVDGGASPRTTLDGMGQPDGLIDQDAVVPPPDTFDGAAEDSFMGEIEPAEELEEIEAEADRDPSKPPPPPDQAKAGKKAVARGVCDICGRDPVWYPDHQRWYCEHCHKFL